jgi:hypothetical protein
MRHRERVLESTSTHCYAKGWSSDYRDVPAATDPSVIKDFDYVTKEATESMDDVVTPSWNVLRASGGIANNPMVKVTSVVEDKLMDIYIAHSAQVRSGEPPDYDWGDVSTYLYVGGNPSSASCAARGGLLDLPACDRSYWKDLALTKAWSNASLDEVQALVMIGESRKTVLSMISMFRRLIKILKSIKKLDTYALKREVTAKELANRYMELRYAIRPLMYDFNGVVAALKYKASETTNRLTFRGHEYFTDEIVEHENVYNGQFSNGESVGERSFDTMKRSAVSFDVRAGVLTQLKTINELHVWGFANPIESAWELVPFSFVIDWFLNVGNTIAAWTPNFGLNTLASWVVTEEISEQSYQILGTHSALPAPSETVEPSSHQNQLSNCYYCLTTTTKTRTPDPSRRIMPTMKVNLDVFKLTDLLIIATYLFNKR